MSNQTTQKDMQILENFIFDHPEDLPVSFTYGELYKSTKAIGIPEEFNPEIKTEIKDGIKITTFTGVNEKGLEIKVECKQYPNHPVVQYVAYLTNTSDKDSDVIRYFRVFDKLIKGSNPTITYGNGDTIDARGYDFKTEQLLHNIFLTTYDGTACNGSSPFIKLGFNEYNLRLAVGWPGSWLAAIRPVCSPDYGVQFSLEQKRCVISLHPGETIRTPSITIMAYEGDENKGINLWRNWYFNHIMPRPGGKKLTPKTTMYAPMPGFKEMCGATENQQLDAIDNYIQNGFTPDVWWIDAGWYDCSPDEWTDTGNWYPDKNRFPDGLAHIGKKCHEKGIDFLLWFEPERLRKNSEIWREHPEWVLTNPHFDGLEQNFEEMLLNLAIPECVEWITDKIDGLIKEYGVDIYRQDFNFYPLVSFPFWETYEDYNRQGALENLHIQGYLKFWDNLLERCAAGGRRNEMEALSRSVFLHYTDVGYGCHPIKQNQYNVMNEWMPYYRSAALDWRDENNVYCQTNYHAADWFTLYNTIAPAIQIIGYLNSEESKKMYQEFIPVWRKAADMMLESDFYPLTECKKRTDGFYAVQFDVPEKRSGFINIVSNVDNPSENGVFYPHFVENEIYKFTNSATGEELTISGENLKSGFNVSMKKASGTIWFYTY